MTSTAPRAAPFPFEAVYNFRDVGATINALCHRRVLKEGVLFRSGRLDDATPADREMLRGLGLKTLIDLRTRSEHIEKAHADGSRNGDGSAAAETEALLGKPQPRWSTVHVNFVGRRFQLQLVRQLGWWDLVRFLVLLLLRCRLAAIRILGRKVLTPKGLVGLACDTLRYSQPEILQALTVMCDPTAYPLAIACTQGKDRTGLLTFLALSLLDRVPREAIRRDYALSNEGLRPAREMLLREHREIGMDEAYLDAPEELLPSVGRWLEANYGGVAEYLTAIGFGEGMQRQLREVLAAD